MFEKDIYGSLNGLFGKSFSGKTTYLYDLITNQLNLNKKVLFISSQHEPIKKSFDITHKKLVMVITEAHENKELQGIIINQINKNEYDFIAIDLYHINHSDIEFLREISFTHKIPIIFTSYIRDQFGKEDLVINENKASLLRVLDRILIINKYKLSFLERIKYFFMFWKPKPNYKINIIKNRFGPYTSFTKHLS